MTSQEQSLISGLVDRVRNTQLPDKDADAERLLQAGLASNPDALYILAQTVLVQGFALEQAQKQMADLKGELARAQQQSSQPPAPEKHTSFLGSIFGSHENAAAPPPPPAPPQGGGYAPVAGYAPVQTAGYAPAQAAVPGYAPTSAPAMQGGGGGFLRSAAQTAAGVAAGALAFQGVESLLHGFGGGGMGSGFGSFGNEGGRPEEIINNNYYGDQDRGRDAGSSDLEDRRGDDGDQNGGGSDPGNNIFTDSNRSNFAGTNSGDDGDSSSFGDDGSGSGTDDYTTDVSGDDGGSFDGGSFDDGGDLGGGDSSF